MTRNRSRGAGPVALAILAPLSLLIASPCHADDGANARPVTLPPFIVKDSASRDSLWNWGYMSFQGYEVLTGCGRGASNEFITGAARQISVLREIAPAVFELPPSVPTALILMNARQAEAISDDMRKVMSERPADPNRSAVSANSRSIYFPQLRLHDSESTSINMVLGDPRFSRSIVLEPGYIRYLMETRVPRLPAWYIEAMTDLYRNAEFGSSDIRPQVNGWAIVGSTSVTFGPVSWITDSDVGPLRNDPTGKRQLMPMEEFLFTPLPPGGADEPSRSRARLWRAEADLFLQWVISDKHGTRTGALKAFLDRGDAGERSEEVFKEAFGMGFETMRGELAAFQSIATQKSVTYYSESVELQDIWRDATPSETRRIWGNWEVMEIQYVRAQEADMVFPYVDQAERTLGEAFRRGERNPGVLSVEGIFESTMNEPEKARPILEAALAARAAYPRAYTELARIRLKDALAKPAGHGGKLTATQVASVLGPLRAAEAFPHRKARPTGSTRLRSGTATRHRRLRTRLSWTRECVISRPTRNWPLSSRCLATGAGRAPPHPVLADPTACWHSKPIPKHPYTQSPCN